MPRSSGAASTLGKKLLAPIAVKPLSTPGTPVPGCGVLTAAIRSHTLVTRRLKDEHSHLERLSSPSYPTQIRYSASTKLLNSSGPPTISSIQLSERWKPLSKAASTSSGHMCKKVVTVQPRSTKPARSVLVSNYRRRRGTVFPAAADLISKSSRQLAENPANR